MSQENNNAMPKNVKIMLAILAVFMPIFLAIPLWIWQSKPQQQNVETHAMLQAERLAPIGRVYVQGEQNAQVQAEVAFSAEAVYQSICAACHATGLLDSPKLGDAAAWQARIDARGGVEALIASGIQGLNSMPAKGGAAISDEEFGQVVQYILKAQ